MVLCVRPLLLPDEARWYLAGIIDGEGCVYMHTWQRASTGATVTRRKVLVTNTDEHIVRSAERALGMLGIAYRTSNRPLRSGKTAYEIAVSTNGALLLLHELVPLQCATKRRKLEAMVASIGGRVGKNWRGPERSTKVAVATKAR